MGRKVNAQNDSESEYVKAIYEWVWEVLAKFRSKTQEVISRTHPAARIACSQAHYINLFTHPLGELGTLA